jgi:hypothetical protein
LIEWLGEKAQFDARVPKGSEQVEKRAERATGIECETFLFKGVSTLARMIPNRRSEGSLCGAKSLEALVRDVVFARPMAYQVSRRVLEMIFR